MVLLNGSRLYLRFPVVHIMRCYGAALSHVSVTQRAFIASQKTSISLNTTRARKAGARWQTTTCARAGVCATRPVSVYRVYCLTLVGQ